MITGSINNNKNQILLLNNRYLKRAVDIIAEKDFTNVDNSKIEVEKDNFFYFLITYETKDNINQALAEVHKKYIDFHYMIYGEELMGYAGSTYSKPTGTDYNEEKDIGFFTTVSNENFFILKKGLFAIFYPYEIHRPGLRSNEVASIKKIVFKIKAEE